MDNNNKQARAAADLAPTVNSNLDPEVIWLARVQEIYDPRALLWLQKVRDARNPRCCSKLPDNSAGKDG